MTALPLLVVRPEPGASATLAAAAGLGLDARAVPLFAIEPVRWEPPDARGFDAVLFASANALRHGGPELARFTALAAYAVGEMTAQAARAAGFTVVAVGRGRAQTLLPLIERDGRRRILRPAGQAHVALLVPPTIMVTTIVVYTARALPLAPQMAERLLGGAVVALHSAEAARHFAAQADAWGLARCRIALACLAPRIAAAAGQGWRAVSAVDQPDEEALLALAARMCQNP